MHVRQWVFLFAVATWISACGSPAADHEFQPVSIGTDSVHSQLAPLARAIGDRRIVLLGENGHGVGQLTSAKVELIAWLHRELGFEVVIMESGFFECGRAWRRAAELSAREMLFDCLRYPFQQAELLPLFETIRASRASGQPLELAGMDPQAQGFDAGERPLVLHAVLAGRDAELARRVASYDSALFLVADSGGLGDEAGPWLLEHGAAAAAAYDSAAALTTGWDRWAFLLGRGLVERLDARAQAEAAGEEEAPAAFYEKRDEWMARAVAALADSIAGPRKVVVWLHNDHARYGRFASGRHEVRSVGGFLREWYGDDVYSIGFFMGRGTIADNGRRTRDVGPPPQDGVESFLAAAGHRAGYLVLNGSQDAAMRAWADSSRPYLRMGITPMELVPSAEFDALFYIDSVGPPTYSFP